MDTKMPDGLQTLSRLINSRNAGVPMLETMSLQLVEVEPGYVRFDARPGEQHLNPMGVIHGGFAATALDSATGCAIHSLLEPGVHYGTIDLNVKMTRPVLPGQQLHAEARVVNISRRLGVSEGKLLDDDGKVYAWASATCMIYRD